jgi:DNA (cytosine-5)-methyltransferase 1
LKAVELFCGSGGMSFGLAQAGLKVVKAFDNSKAAVANYNHNVGGHAEEADLSDLLAVVPAIIELAPDIICGGPPCQDYSNAGKKQEGNNARLTLAYAMIVAAVRPQWFLMENVVPALGSENWKRARAILSRAGYGISETRIDCSWYGVPQARRRAIVIGRLGERDGFIDAAVHAARSEQRMTPRRYFGLTSGRSAFPFPSSYRYQDFQLVLKGHLYSRPFRDGRGVRSIDEPATTVTHTSSERPTRRYLSNPHRKDAIPADETAVLNVRQIQELQGLPADWKWVKGNKSEIMQMIANGVPAPTAKIIGQVIIARHQGKMMPEIEGRFLQWLVRGRRRSLATARNFRSYLGRARRILKGRTYAIAEMELAALEAMPEFQALGKGTRSDLRQALLLYREYQDRNNLRADQVGAESQPERTIDLAALMADMPTSRDVPHDITDRYVTV